MLKESHKENVELISSLQEYQTLANKEIKQCRLDISNMLKEISNLKY